MKECTFSPRINRSRSKSGRRNYNDLLNWGQEKRFKQTNARLNSMLGGQCSFSPNINQRSRQLAGRRSGPIHKRLMNAGEDADEKLETLRQQADKGLYKPSIGWKSRQLAKKVKDINLIRQDNGQTNNLDFYYAVPGNSSKGTLYRAGPSAGPADSKCMNRHTERCEAFERKEKSIPGKKVNPNPTYVSPYAKEIM